MLSSGIEAVGIRQSVLKIRKISQLESSRRTCNIPLRFFECTSFAIVPIVLVVVPLALRGWEFSSSTRRIILQAGKELPVFTVSTIPTASKFGQSQEDNILYTLYTYVKCLFVYISCFQLLFQYLQKKYIFTIRTRSLFSSLTSKSLNEFYHVTILLYS